jgi:L-alanine-DL-glutamate epimerase-like enolase superfamily enzyme
VSPNKWDVKATVADLPLKERFVIARESWDVAQNVVVEVGYDGLSGMGACDPAGRWGESVDSVLEAIESVEFERLANPFDIETLSQLLPAGSARAAIDIAVHDLAAQLAGVPLYKFLGLRGDGLPPTSVTVPISTVDAMVARAEKLRDYPVLKLKVGFDGDVETVRSIRQVYDGGLRIDGTTGLPRCPHSTSSSASSRSTRTTRLAFGALPNAPQSRCSRTKPCARQATSPGLPERSLA